MTFSDPIAQILTMMRNAIMAQHKYVDGYLSKMNIELIKILKEYGFIDNYLINDKIGKVRIFLKYNNRNPVLHGLKRVSTPGLRKYTSCDRIPRVNNGQGIAILTTSKGVIEGEQAKKLKVGGELLCYIW